VEKDVEVPDIEFMFHTVPAQTRLWFPGIVAPYQDAYAIRPTLLHPESHGEILLRSADARDAPRIIYNFFSSPNDMPRLVAGFKRAREVGEQSAMAPYRGVEASPGPSCRTDADIEAFIRRTTITAHHPCATCRMGSDASAPLDPALRLRGIDGLRVADASAMPDIITAHINACVLMMGEKAADLIRADA
jgi:4-pyridoxate dehydrogenase